MKRFSVRVPATIANLGPGYDILGVAVQMYLDLDVEEKADPGSRYKFIIRGSEKELPQDENAVLEGMKRGSAAAGGELPPHTATVRSGIPLRKGLGSSAAARVAGAAAGFLLSGGEFHQEAAALEAFRLEGHADNAYPAALGGLVVCSASGDEVIYDRIVIGEGLGIAAVLPDIEVSTDAAREALPGSVSYEDAVYSSSRACLMVRALSRGDFSGLGRLMDDRLHQPFRKKLIPGYDSLVRAAAGAGAWGTAIAGSGPSVFCFAPPEAAHAAGEAMRREWTRFGVVSEVFVTGVSEKGIIVTL